MAISINDSQDSRTLAIVNVDPHLIMNITSAERFSSAFTYSISGRRHTVILYLMLFSRRQD